MARVVKELLESKEIDEDERASQAYELATMLRKVGVRPDHPLRKKLGKYQAPAVPATAPASASASAAK